MAVTLQLLRLLGVRIRGTQFSFPEASITLLVDYFLDGICQSLVYATYRDPGAMNRDISRRNALVKRRRGPAAKPADCYRLPGTRAGNRYPRPKRGNKI